MLGVRADGTKEFIAVEDGYRESTESLLAVLPDLARRGMQVSRTCRFRGLGWLRALLRLMLPPITRMQLAGAYT